MSLHASNVTVNIFTVSVQLLSMQRLADVIQLIRMSMPRSTDPLLPDTAFMNADLSTDDQLVQLLEEFPWPVSLGITDKAFNALTLHRSFDANSLYPARYAGWDITYIPVGFSVKVLASDGEEDSRTAFRHVTTDPGYIMLQLGAVSLTMVIHRIYRLRHHGDLLWLITRALQKEEQSGYKLLCRDPFSGIAHISDEDVQKLLRPMFSYPQKLDDISVRIVAYKDHLPNQVLPMYMHGDLVIYIPFGVRHLSLRRGPTPDHANYAPNLCPGVQVACNSNSGTSGVAVQYKGVKYVTGANHTLVDTQVKHSSQDLHVGDVCHRFLHLGEDICLWRPLKAIQFSNDACDIGAVHSVAPLMAADRPVAWSGYKSGRSTGVVLHGLQMLEDFANPFSHHANLNALTVGPLASYCLVLRTDSAEMVSPGTCGAPVIWDDGSNRLVGFVKYGLIASISHIVTDDEMDIDKIIRIIWVSPVIITSIPLIYIEEEL